MGVVTPRVHFLASGLSLLAFLAWCQTAVLPLAPFSRLVPPPSSLDSSKTASSGGGPLMARSPVEGGPAHVRNWTLPHDGTERRRNDFEVILEHNTAAVNAALDASDAASSTPEETSTAARPISAAVVYLTDTSPRSRARTLTSVETLARNVPFHTLHPILFFHDGDFNHPSTQRAFRAAWAARVAAVRADADPALKVDGDGGTNAGVLADKMEALGELFEWIAVDLEAPWEARDLNANGDVPFGDRWPGYHSMCRFFAITIFEHPRTRDLDYYMRMDTDSYMPTPLCFDPFVRMRTRGKAYAAHGKWDDIPYVTRGLWAFLARYTAARPALRARVEADWRMPLQDGTEVALEEEEGTFPGWPTNFEVVELRAFQTDEVREWFRTLGGNLEGFYGRRWGDSPLRYATTAMFLDPSRVDMICDMDYHHQGFAGPGCSCDGVMPAV